MTGNYRFIHKLTAFLMLFALSAPVFALVTNNNASSRRKSLTEDQKILHVLNRLGFGSRPGDVERVKLMGLQKYIEQQLNPASINDTVAESKVKNLEIFNMSTAEVFAKYPNPGALLRQLEGGRRNQNQANNNQNQMPNNQTQTPNNQPADEQMTDKDRQERQAKLREYYKEYDLRPANQLLPQITANRVLRAVYSEKQLQEVMVDFWQNHFNVYSGKAAVRWYIPSYERDVLRKNALGNFKDLVAGTAQHPAMLFYLDNFESVSPNAQANNNRGNGRLQQMLQNGT